MQRPPIAAWSISAELETMDGGHRNSVFRTVGLAEELVFKSTRRTPEAIAWLLPVHEFARQSGFLVPQFQKSVRGHLIENGWTCEQLVQGEPLSANGLEEIASKVADFHRLTRAVPQRPSFRSSKSLLDFDSGGDIDFNGMPPSIVESCREAWRQVSNFPCSVVHGDLNSSNLIRTTDGKVALLDWDECRRDHSIFDTGQVATTSNLIRRALLAWEVACSWWIEPEHARELVRKLT